MMSTGANGPSRSWNGRNSGAKRSKSCAKSVIVSAQGCSTPNAACLPGRWQSRVPPLSWVRITGSRALESSPSEPRQIPHLQCHHLEQVLAEYVAHYNEHRPHRGLDQQASRNLGLVPDLIDEPDLVQLRRNEITRRP